MAGKTEISCITRVIPERFTGNPMFTIRRYIDPRILYFTEESMLFKKLLDISNIGSIIDLRSVSFSILI